MGSFLATLTEAQPPYPSLQAVRDALARGGAEEQLQARGTLIALFDKPGLRLKMRLLIEELLQAEGQNASSASAPKLGSISVPEGGVREGAALEGQAEGEGAPLAALGEQEVALTDDEAEQEGKDESSDDDEAELTASVESNSAAVEGKVDDSPSSSRDAAQSTSAATDGATPTASSAAASSAPLTANAKPLWRQVLDKSSGKPYWYNRQTKETTWVNPFPDGDSAPAAAAADASSAPVVTAAASDAAASSNTEASGEAAKKPQKPVSEGTRAKELSAVFFLFEISPRLLSFAWRIVLLPSFGAR